MKKHSFAMWYGAGAVAVIGLVAACGGKVTWVEDGATQSGGAGGTGSSTSKATSSSTKSVTSTTNVSTVQQGTSVVATSSTSLMPGCDTGEFGDINSDVCQNCIDCSLNSVCAQQYDEFNSDPDAQAFIDCLDNCNGPMCEQKCQMQHPQGAQIYSQLLECVLCQTCPNNCDANSNCFGPPPPNGSSTGQGPGSGGGPPPN